MSLVKKADHSSAESWIELGSQSFWRRLRWLLLGKDWTGVRVKARARTGAISFGTIAWNRYSSEYRAMKFNLLQSKSIGSMWKLLGEPSSYTELYLYTLIPRLLEFLATLAKSYVFGRIFHACIICLAGPTLRGMEVKRLVVG
jgi:hypothetical protein